MACARTRLAAHGRRSRLRGFADGTGGGAGEIRELDRAAGDGNQQPARRLSVRAVPLRRSAPVGSVACAMRTKTIVVPKASVRTAHATCYFTFMPSCAPESGASR